MTVNNLSNTPFEVIMKCFFKAFENYYVKMPADPIYYRKRWEAAKVDFRFSYGMFDNGELVGFIINAVDKREGRLIAFNTGTGVVPGHRGKRIIKSIYEFALQDLKQNGIQESRLEVITDNKIAIKSYQSIGFEITKTYQCFKGKLLVESDKDFSLKKIDLNKVDWEKLPNQNAYSWDNQKETILQKDYFFYQVYCQETPESYFIIEPDRQYLAQFDVYANCESKTWNRLFSAIYEISNQININNVDTQFKNKLKVLNNVGLTRFIDQFEMKLTL